MSINEQKDIMFIACLAGFHERRERALQLPVPSTLLISLHQYGGLLVGGEMLEELGRMSEAEEIQEKLTENRERVTQIHGWVQKMVERQDGWAESTRKRNVRKVKKWMAEAEELFGESEQLIGRLSELEGDVV
jgi:hypothetical protein